MTLFRPKVTTPEPAAAPPTVDQAADLQDQSDKLRRRRGRASTILVPDRATSPMTGTAAVLGA